MAAAPGAGPPPPDPAALLAAIDPPAGFALAATGSYARGEATAHSDLDLTLIVDPAVPEAEVARVAESIWYPLWDHPIPVDHSVRTPAAALAAAEADPAVFLALLDLAHLRGTEELTAELRARLRTAWRRGMPGRFDALIGTAAARWRRCGAVTAMTRPDLKHGRGGLRDHDLLRALALAQIADTGGTDAARGVLLDIRARLHLAARRAHDVLDPEFAELIHADLGHPDGRALQRGLADAAAEIDAALTRATGTARAALPRRTALRRPVRRSLDEGVVAHGGQVALARGADLGDPGLPLRAAASMARTGMAAGEATWRRLAGCPAPPRPWPAAVLADLLAVLAADPGVLRDLDAHGLLEPLLPDWPAIRGLVPRERSHIRTVDEHTIAVVAGAAARRTRVARPDLLLLAALLHDLGKGRDRPHAEVGAGIAAGFAAAAGLPAADAATLRVLVREHQRLAELATRADPAAPATAAALVERLADAGDPALALDVLEVLTEADSLGTGPGVWTPSRAAGVRRLAAGARERLAGAVPGPPEPPPAPEPGPVAVAGWTVRLADPAGAAALAGLLRALAAAGCAVASATAVFDDAGVRAEVVLRPRHGGPPRPEALRARSRAAGRPGPAAPPTPGPAPAAPADARLLRRGPGGGVVELRAPDRPGLLAEVVAAAGAELAWLRAGTVAGTAVDLLGARPGRAAAAETGVLGVLGAGYGEGVSAR